jgi:hypothetical protein
MFSKHTHTKEIKLSCTLAKDRSMAGIVNLTADQGATFTQRLTWKIDGNPVNLTGYTARMKVKNTIRNNVVVSITHLSGITLGGSAGTIDLAISAADTTTLIPGKYSYDLELVAPGGTVTRLIRGHFTVTPEVTV